MNNGKNKGKVVLAIGAHPDDVEFLMAGTLALLHREGCIVYIASAGTGDMGSVKLRNYEIASIRYKEAKKSARILDAAYFCLGESDLHIVFDNLTRFKVAELIRRINPDIVFTHSPQDYMKDHEIVADLTWDACFNASVPNYSTNQTNPANPTPRIPYLYYADPIEGRDRFGEKIFAQFYINISSVIKVKERMLSCHKSQRDYLKVKHGMDQYLNSMREWSQENGQAVGVRYAEGFRQHRGHPFPKDNILWKLLKPFFKENCEIVNNQKEGNTDAKD